ALGTAGEGLRHRHVRVGLAGDAEGGRDRAPVDGEGIARAIVPLRKGRRAGSEESDGRSREGPSEETHISNNVHDPAIVAVRPMRREDVDAYAGWKRHSD